MHKHHSSERQPVRVRTQRTFEVEGEVHDGGARGAHVWKLGLQVAERTQRDDERVGQRLLDEAEQRQARDARRLARRRQLRRQLYRRVLLRQTRLKLHQYY